MAKTRASRRQPIAALDAAADYGPSMRRTRGGYWESAGAGQCVLEDREDVAHDLNSAGRRPVVRGARRWCAIAALETDGVITSRQCKAAERFLDDLSRAQGASSASFMAMVCSGTQLAGVTEGQRRALRAVEKVRLMLGLNPDHVLWAVVVDNLTVPQYAARHRIRASDPYGWLRVSLDQLDSFYNPIMTPRHVVSSGFGQPQ